MNATKGVDQRFPKGLEDLEQRKRETEQARLTSTALAKAKRELATWLGTMSLTNAASLTEELGRYLEELRVDDVDLRFDAFAKLNAFLRHDNAQVPDIARYCLRCQEQAIARLQNDGAGKHRTPRDVQRVVDEGLWCLLFDPGELDRFKRRMEAH